MQQSPGQYGQRQPQGAGQYGPGQQQGPGGQQPPPGQPPFGGGVHQWQPEPKKKRAKLVPLIAALAMVLVIGGGGIFAYGRLTGGGQPAEVLPGNAVAYGRIDLNPSAGQRVAALRFLLKFPSVKDKMGLTSDQDDLRLKLFELLKKESGDDLADVDYDKDIKPWLGDRAGVAVLPAADGDTKGEPEVVAAIQIKDEGEAGKGLDKLFADEKEKPARAFKEGYVLLSEHQAGVDKAVATSKDTSLESNQKFSKDMADLGEPGFASFWLDLKGLAAFGGRRVGHDRLAGLPDSSMAAALRFDAQYVELKGIARGSQEIKTGTSDAGDFVAKLPDSTAGAIAVSGGSDLVDTAWAAMKQSGMDVEELIGRFAGESGLVLPDDLKTLLGKNFALAVDKDKDAEQSPKVAARIQTDPAKGEQVVGKLTELMRTRSRAQIPIEIAKDTETLVVSTNKEYADAVLKGGNLGQSGNFQQAVPDTKGAVTVGYVDFEALSGLSRRFSSDKDLAALRSAGYAARITSGTDAEFTFRVVAK